MELRASKRGAEYPTWRRIQAIGPNLQVVRWREPRIGSIAAPRKTGAKGALLSWREGSEPNGNWIRPPSSLSSAWVASDRSGYFRDDPHR